MIPLALLQISYVVHDLWGFTICAAIYAVNLIHALIFISGKQATVLSAAEAQQ